MIYRYQILIEYEGSKFNGWQSQPKGRTVQKFIQNKLSKILHQRVSLVGSGRTDSGVHAIEQSAHFDIKKKIKDNKKFLNTLNFFLNKNLISIKKIKKKGKNFHSRFSAKKRLYKYIIFNRDSSPSIEKNRGWHIKKKLDLKIMKIGAKKLEGTNDFSTFRSSTCGAKSPIRTIDYVKICKKKEIIEIKIKSKSFLQQQVRSMVGCLKYLGEKKWTKEKFYQVLMSRNRNECAPPAPAHGLYLEKVIY